MAMDFSALCLAPQMAVFGRKVTVTPLQSFPLGAPYAVNGIFTVTQVSIPTDDGGFLSSVALKLGIRMSDFAIPLLQGDLISTEVINLPLGYWQGIIDPTISLDFIIDDSTPDGQGGAVCVLKRVLP
jgi:hypothetical protein